VKLDLFLTSQATVSIMAEDRNGDPLRESSPAGNLDDAVKFKDPLLTGLDRESDDDGVSAIACCFVRSHTIQ
jgi:hypothetical protein